jgi:hypothetical protein
MKSKQESKLQRLIASSSEEEIKLTKQFLFNKLRAAIAGLTEDQVASCVPITHRKIDLADFPIEALILFERNLRKLQNTEK